jgi:hypothetical protein
MYALHYCTLQNCMQAAGAAGLVIVNSEEGNKHPPGPDAIDLDMFVAMITRDEGIALIHVSDAPSIHHNTKHRHILSLCQISLRTL